MEILLPDDGDLWRARGFDLDAEGRFTAGAVGLRAGAAELALRAPLEPGAAGLPIGADVPAGGPQEHPNGALAVDHLVVITPDLAATSEALGAAGAPLRRDAGRLRFHRCGPLILELAPVEDGPARFWGVTFTVSELPTGAGYGDPREAVQPGRRIVTARGGTTPVAFITARP